MEEEMKFCLPEGFGMTEEMLNQIIDARVEKRIKELMQRGVISMQKTKDF